MDKQQKQIEEMAKRLPTIEEIEKEYKEWAVDLLKVRFDLKPEAFDKHHKNNYSFENCADCLWNKIKGSIEELLWIRENQIPENAVVILDEEMEDFAEMFAKSPQMQETMNGLIKAWEKETAEKFAEMLKEELKKLELGGWVEVETKCFNKIVDEICKEFLRRVRNENCI